MRHGTDGANPIAHGRPGATDSEAALQEELRRESAEHDALGGDTATNRILTGSSTWVTLGAEHGAPTADDTQTADAPRPRAAP